MSPLEIVILVVVVAALAFAVYSFFRGGDKEEKRSRKSKDLSAQRSAASARRVAESWTHARGGKVYGPVNIEINGRSMQADFMVVGFYGITAVRCVGYGGEIYGTKDEAEWLHIVKGEREHVPNPMLGLTEGARVIRDTLFAAKQKNVPVEMVTVFTNDKLKIAVPPSVGFYTVKSWKKNMQRDKYTQDKKVDVDKALAAVQQYTKE